MSRQARDWAWENTFDCTISEAIVMLRVAEFAQEKDGHSCILAIATIVKYTRCSERNVRSAIDKLAKRHICVEKGIGRGNHHRFSFPQVTTKGIASAPFVRENAATVATLAETNVAEAATFSEEKRQIASLNVANPDILSIYEPLLTNEEEEDDALLPFIDDLRAISNRAPTTEERALIAEHSATFEGRRRLGRALKVLRKQWGEIDLKHNCAGYLARVLENLESGGVSAPLDPNRYERDVAPAPEQISIDQSARHIDAGNQRLDVSQVILPEPVPPALLAPPSAVYAQPKPLQASQSLWEKSLAEFQLQLASATFDAWLRNTYVIDGSDDSLTIGTQNKYAKEWLENRLATVVRRTVKSIAGRPIDVFFVFDQNQPGLH